MLMNVDEFDVEVKRKFCIGVGLLIEKLNEESGCNVMWLMYNEFIEERGVVKMNVLEMVVNGVVEKSGKGVGEVRNVVENMSCVGGEIEWDWCELEMDECVEYEKWVSEVCEELGVDLEF
ncbi:hypothetical protein D3C87_1085540 [compost metagenome]